MAVVCGPRGRPDTERTAVRHGHGHGHEAGSVTLGGRLVPVTRPRVRAADGSGELPGPAYDRTSAGQRPDHALRVLIFCGSPDRVRRGFS